MTAVEESKDRQINVYWPPQKHKFDIKVFLKEGRTKGHVIYASDGKPFLVKYSELLIKEGKPCSLVIRLADPSVSKKDIVSPSYVSETFYHFFRPNRDADEDYFCLDDGGLVVAEIVLEADESGLLYLIDDLNYKHITKAVLDKYYGSHRGQYDHIGRSMVGIAGRVLNEGYGIGFLGVKTDKTKGFYWEISGHPPEKPFIPRIIGQLECIRDIKARREIRESIYMGIIRNIIIRRFDPYMIIGCDINIDEAWKSHCSEIRSILLDNKPILSWLLEESKDAVKAEGVGSFIDKMMTDYMTKNIEWFKSINYGMRRLKKAQQTGDKTQRDRLMDELINIEGDPIVKQGLKNLKKSAISIDIITMIHEILNQLSFIFPILDLGRIEEIKIGIDLHKRC
ncbi:MAG: hypothetical protein MUO26_09220 [Methanotrichaceae archaeon]|nr:hypothetical protein [Methanotrichaceae archaeon]